MFGSIQTFASPLHVDMGSLFFAREEEEPKRAVAKNRWAHC